MQPRFSNPLTHSNWLNVTWLHRKKSKPKTMLDYHLPKCWIIVKFCLAGNWLLAFLPCYSFMYCWETLGVQLICLILFNWKKCSNEELAAVVQDFVLLRGFSFPSPNWGTNDLYMPFLAALTYKLFKAEELDYEHLKTKLVWVSQRFWDWTLNLGLN